MNPSRIVTVLADPSGSASEDVRAAMLIVCSRVRSQARPFRTFDCDTAQSRNSRSRHRLRNSSRLTRLYFPIDTVGM